MGIFIRLYFKALDRLKESTAGETQKQICNLFEEIASKNNMTLQRKELSGDVQELEEKKIGKLASFAPIKVTRDTSKSILPAETSTPFPIKKDKAKLYHSSSSLSQAELVNKLGINTHVLTQNKQCEITITKELSTGSKTDTIEKNDPLRMNGK